MPNLIDPATGKPFGSMPDWHRDINPDSLIPMFGHFFKFEGIDPAKPEILFLKYDKPCKKKGKKK
jgi:hypothetical protein